MYNITENHTRLKIIYEKTTSEIINLQHIASKLI